MLLRTRRAPAACSWCRHRKVRCDASILGRPCTRCHQDGRSNCVLRAKIRQKRPKTSPDQPPLPSPDDVEQQQHSNPDNPLRRTDNAVDTSERRSGAQKQRESEYPFIDWQFLSSSLPPEDITFLSSKGCQTLPCEDPIDEFVRQYFKRIHPGVPVVDEAEFWRIYEGCSGVGKKLSLFVFQAILFASCSLVSLETLRRCGFSDKRDARKQLHGRAKLLFDLKAETRPSAKAQGAVLLTHHTSAEDPQAGSLWLMRAIESTMVIDALPSLHAVENVPESLKKRLWWSILLRDRSLCIGLRRRPQVPVEYCDWLTEEDFEDEIQHSRVYDEAMKRRLLKALQEQCQLAVLLSDLVSLIFVPRAIPSCFLSVEEFDGLMTTIERIRLALVEWEARSPLPFPTPTGKANIDDPVDILTNLTFMYLHAAQVDLAQYAAFMIEENMSLSKDTYDQRVLEIGRDLKHGIEGLTLAMEYFSIQGNLESLPLSVLGYVGMPLILAAIDMKLSSSYEEMTTRKKRLDSLSVIIRHSYTLYDVTDYVAVGINHILQLAYFTTKNLFRQWKQPGNNIIENLHSGDNRMRDLLRAESQQQQQSTKLSGRATSWVDAFVLWPRAYLLISTSVDYSLAVGRLPYVNALPELVRHIPAMGAVFTLPWTINANVHPVAKSMRRQSNYSLAHRRASSRSNQSKVRPGPAGSDERAKHRQSGARIIPGAVREDPLVIESPKGETRMASGDNCTIINLDYMDLGSAPSSFANLAPVGLSSPKDREPRLEQENDHDDDSAAGTHFDTDFLDEITQELFRGDWEDV